VGVEDPVAKEDIVGVEDQEGMADIMVAMEAIVGIMVGMADTMVGSFPDYLSAVS